MIKFVYFLCIPTEDFELNFELLIRLIFKITLIAKSYSVYICGQLKAFYLQMQEKLIINASNNRKISAYQIYFNQKHYCMAFVTFNLPWIWCLWKLWKIKLIKNTMYLYLQTLRPFRSTNLKFKCICRNVVVNQNKDDNYKWKDQVNEESEIIVMITVNNKRIDLFYLTY